jgi:hypothetical protein
LLEEMSIKVKKTDIYINVYIYMLTINIKLFNFFLIFLIFLIFLPKV